MDSSERINRHLALQLGISRREADELVESGRVHINGIPVKLGGRVASGDIVTVDQKTIRQDTPFVYLALNKPIGHVCSRKRQGDTPTIYELLPEKYHALKPVGRLDKNSSGIILLTNDGTFAHQMTHPSFYKVKIYEATLDTPLQPLHHQMISDHGIVLEDGKSQLGLARQEESNDLRWTITMSEGRNRQIRRTFAALGYEVTALHRTAFGAYSLGDLSEGKYVELHIPEASSHPATA